MQYKKILTFCLLLFFSHLISAQTVVPNDSVVTPQIDYNEPKEYQIADIQVEGADSYDDFVLIGFSGLQVGQKIVIPGDDITSAVKKFWEQSMFSDVKIELTKVEGDKAWLTIYLQLRPKVSEIIYKGLKKAEIEDIEKRIGILKDKQITPNMSDRATKSIKKYLDEKGFSNADIKVYQMDDPAKPGFVKVDIDVDKKLKTRVHKIYISGNDKLDALQINKAMKKTNDNNIINIFRTKKFVKDLYEKDKIAAIEKYNEFGYRDAYLVSDSVVPFDDKSVDVYMKFNEGEKYYFRDIKWIGNTIYPYETLNQFLGIKKGDVYNLRLLNKRLQEDEDAVAKLYSNKGYLFFNIQPIEVAIQNDSIDFEIHMVEGKPATINEVKITGNTRVYENVVRRELRTVPGALYSQDDIMRTLRELAQMGHFDPEKLSKDMMEGGLKPNPENGTVDLTYKLETKSSDQVEFSAGWGAAGIVGSLGLKFSNFAIQNIFKPETYRIVPQGEGQTFSINARTNGNYYSSFSLSFLEPWLGGKRPNSLSVSLYYTATSGMSDRYLNAYSSMSSMYGG
ncbi:MAG TPA: POTRA domain-containing protein, partial [Paludibacteraceae bacterium]|nr:POTRA domain-containing protein [Paludibacteraceae bacterium]